MGVFDKVEREIYPLINLSYSFPDYATAMIKHERPDWIRTDKSLGLEITHSQSNHIGYTINLANNFLGKSKNDFPKKDLLSFRGKSFWDENNKLYAITASELTDNGQQHIQLALKSANTKLNKLNRDGFLKCTVNSLYIYSTFSLCIEDCYIFQKEYQLLSEKYTNIYQKIFLGDNTQTVYFDIPKNQMTVYQFSLEEIAVMNNDVHALRCEINWNEGSLFCYTPQIIPRGKSISYRIDELEDNTDCIIAHNLYKGRT